MNIRSIANALNFNKLDALIASLQCKPDVISVCEKPLHSGPYCNLDGYNFVSNCHKILRGGGVAFFVENSLQFDTIDELFVMNEKNFESLVINVKVGKATVVCGVIYRSSSDDLKAHQEFRFQLTECLEKLDAKRKCFIFGDFSYDLAKSVENTHVRNFTEVMLDHNFCSLINKPTRITDTGATVLDQIWINSYSDHIKSGIILHSISDHLPLFMCAANSKVISSNSLTRNFNDMNIKNFILA